MTRRPTFFSAASSLAAILILAAGCSEHSPTAIQLEPSVVSSARAEIGAKVSPMLAATRYAAGTYAAVIGPEGGSLAFGIGAMEFPEGALSRPTRITAEVDGATLGVKFGPSGLVFPAEAQPILSFKGDVKDPAQLTIAHVSEKDEVIEFLSTTLASGIWQAEVSHYSKYVLITP